MATMPIFTDNVPEVSIKGDLVYLGMEGGKSVCTTLSLFRAFIQRGQAALSIHDHPRVKVVQFKPPEH